MRWRALVVAVAAAYVIGAVLSVGVMALIYNTRDTARQGKEVGCLLVRVLEDQIDKEERVIRDTRASLRDPIDRATRMVRVRTIATREGSLRRQATFTKQLRDVVDCPPHLRSPVTR